MSLHDAVEANDVAVVRRLLVLGADPDRGHPIQHAVEHRDRECLRLLLEHGARVQGSGALSALIGRDDPEGVRILVAAGADPGRPHAPGAAPTGLLPDMTEHPLAAAAQRDSAGVAEALLEEGGDPDAVCRDGRSALRAAVRRGRPDVAAALLRHGARDDTDEADHLLGACGRADQTEAEALVARHPDLMTRLSGDDRGRLADVAESGELSAVRLMLELGFPPDARRGIDGGAALHTAAYRGRADVVRLLVGHGADLECRDRQWWSTPLCWALVGSGERPGGPHASDWVAAAEILLEAGASPHGVWVEDKPPSEDVAALLRRHGVTGPRPGLEEAETGLDPAMLDRLAEQLRRAYETGDLELLGSLLDSEVRWGAGPRACWRRDQVLEWFGVLRRRWGSARVREVAAHGDAVKLRLDVPGLGERAQSFRVSGGSVVEIQG